MNSARKINNLIRKTEPTSEEIRKARIAMCLAKSAILKESYEIIKDVTNKNRHQLSKDLFELIEKKNNAYIFILESGNMGAFENYCTNGSVKICTEKSHLTII